LDAVFLPAADRASRAEYENFVPLFFKVAPQRLNDKNDPIDGWTVRVRKKTDTHKLIVSYQLPV
jgi:hypothetical protein